jgi:predicted transglutaminase-like cysteine proteinase
LSNKNLAVAILVNTLILSPNFGMAANTGHQPWSEAVFQHVHQIYGPAAEKRMRDWEAIIAKNYNAPIMTKLEVTNSWLNSLPWIADIKKYHANDYWATPLETIATFGGDCEDIAISKFVMLRHMGVPSENLRLAYVRLKSTGEAHMTLLYIENAEQPAGKRQVQVLDNYVRTIRTGAERTDLVAIYTVDADNNITVYADDGNKRTVANTVEHAKFEKLDKVKKEMAAYRAEYQKLNNGMPFY